MEERMSGSLDGSAGPLGMNGSSSGQSFNSMDFEEEELESYYIFDNQNIKILFLLLYSIVFFICFFGNLTVLLVMCLHWKMRGMTKFCLGNLAFANLCVSIFCIYQNVSIYIIESWIFGSFLCKMYHFTNGVSHTASVLILVVIAVERYLVIVHPFKFRRIITMKRLKILIFVVWTTSAISCMPRLQYIDIIRNPLPSRTKASNNKEVEVICVLHSNLYDYFTSDLLQFLLLFLLPLIIITLLYTKVGLKLRLSKPGSTPSGNNKFCSQSYSASESSEQVQMNNLGGSSSSESQQQQQQQQQQTTTTMMLNNNSRIRRSTVRSTIRRRPPSSRFNAVRMLIVHVITFAICNFPFHLRKLCQNILMESDLDSYFVELATPLSFLLMYTNCAINPIVYAFMSQGFRSCFLEVVTCKVGKRQSNLRL